MPRILLLFMLLIIGCLSYGQEPLKHEKKTYTSPDGKLYVQKDLPVFLWLSTSGDETSEKYKLLSKESEKYSNPMYLDTEGYNSIRSPSAVDPETRKTVYPVRDIVFEVYADGIAPKTKIDYGETKLYTAEGKIHLGNGTLITLSARDEMSGIENIYVSIDGGPFKPYTASIKIEQEKEYSLKYYAVDNVGNAEDVHEKILVLDNSSPVTKIEIEGDKHENVLSGRSKIIIKAEDKGIGVKTVYYSIDKGQEKVYKAPILATYLSQDEHAIHYYAIDKVGNKEQMNQYDFYVDKTAPTIIEEVMGKSFFSGGKEYSSGRARLKLTSFDNKAGVKEVRYSVNGADYEVYSKPVFLTQSSGNLQIKSYAVDHVNNRSNSQTANERTTIPYIDLTGPELAYNLKGPEFKTRDTIFINNKTSITLKGSDSEAGLNRISYSVNGGDQKDFTESFKLDSEGYYTIEYTGFDNVENTSGGSFNVKLDNTGPSIVQSFGTGWLRKENGLAVYPSHTVLFLTATDKVVGFQRITYSLNGGAEKECIGMLRNLPVGKNDMLIKAFDKLGNSTEKTLSFIIE